MGPYLAPIGPLKSLPYPAAIVYSRATKDNCQLQSQQPDAPSMFRKGFGRIFVALHKFQQGKNHINIHFLIFWSCFGKFPWPFLVLFWPPQAPGWSQTDSIRKMLTKSVIKTEIRALGSHFVVIFHSLWGPRRPQNQAQNRSKM